MTQSKKLLALTMGDPAGIGPEIALKSWIDLKEQSDFSFVFAGCPGVIEKTISHLNMVVPVHICESTEEATDAFRNAFPILPIPCSSDVKTGETSSKNAQSVIGAIETCVSLAQDQKVGAVVTNPINKASLKAAAFPFPGHTEFLAFLSGNARPVMMLEGSGLKVVPLTRHIPLKEVSAKINEEELVETTRITHTSLKQFFDIEKPRIAISGLNPHAGEQGVLGDEEEKVIIPAISKLRSQGINAFGPLPADTMFHDSARAKYDVAICMYHDQALIPVKMIGFESGVNITLGLDFIRTSPDHGTALDIAPKFCANANSLISALETAAKMSAHKPGLIR